MSFTSEIFLFAFLPLTLAVYLSFRGARFKNVTLIIASLLFYAWGEGIFVAVLAALAFVNYGFGLAIARFTDRRRFAILVAAVAVDLGFLVWFKYVNFLIENVRALGGLPFDPASPFARVYLPLGVSFFTFHAISYVVDVYRRTSAPRRDPLEILLYFVFFPQLIAGPIIRYSDIAAQLSRRTASVEDLAEGARRFVVGLGKKILIADTLGVSVDRVFAANPGDLSGSLPWFGLAAYTLQIYFDFSGYSDMAIGLARMFGFRFLENFNFPYVAISIREFWRRWNISLSRWFRDYLYVPLGGNRVAAWRIYINLLVVFVLCGLWHGARWTFVALGLIHGLFLILERFPTFNRITSIPIVRNVYVLGVVMFGWLFFRSETFASAFAYLGAMIHPNPVPQAALLNAVEPETVAMFIIGSVLATPLVASRIRLLVQPERGVVPAVLSSFLIPASLVVIFALSVFKLVGGSYTPFIYFRF